jgi:peptidoglycan L-alanyl-D-glutamate endopeptidase CwlK
MKVELALSQMIPELKEKAQLLIDKAKAKGINFIFTTVARPITMQLALYAQGRKPLDFVNGLRKTAGLPPITDDQNKNCVSWVLPQNSKHVVDDKQPLSRAFDIAILFADGKNISYDIKVDVNKDNAPDYIQLAEIGKSVGLIPGAYFTKRDATGKVVPNPDYPHYEV